MGKKYVKNELDRARDELFSHIQRCDVLEAADEDREAWLVETLAYMAERYPALMPNEREELETLARRYMKPPVPHGKEATAQNRDEWQDGEMEASGPEGAAADGAAATPDAAETVEAEPLEAAEEQSATA
ncbi:MAG: hypothetical protein R3195_11655 [Gemmatimonadota bacterium]|nr:hypothetical protein [Gemmatimonadota bacterium]